MITASSAVIAQRGLKPLFRQVFFTPDYLAGLPRGRAMLARFQNRYRAATERLAKDLERYLTYRVFPTEHRKQICTTNLLERSPGETRRQTLCHPPLPRGMRISHADVRHAHHRCRHISLSGRAAFLLAGFPTFP